MTLAYNKSTSGHGTDGQTDRQTDGQSATQYAAPSYGGGRRIKSCQKCVRVCVVTVDVAKMAQ